MQYSFQNGFFSQMNNYNNSCTPTEKHISSTFLSPPINFSTVFGGAHFLKSTFLYFSPELKLSK